MYDILHASRTYKNIRNFISVNFCSELFICLIDTRI